MVKTVCYNCGKKISKKPGQIRNAKHVFCCNHCRSVSISKYRKKGNMTRDAYNKIEDLAKVYKINHRGVL